MNTVANSDFVWKEQTQRKFGASVKKNDVGNWKVTYIALEKMEKKVAHKAKVNDVQQRTMSAASAIFGFNVNPNQSAYYPTQSSSVMFGGQMRKFTVYKPTN